MTFSFSRINLFCKCKYAFYQKYIAKEKGIDNFYAQNGSLIHKICELVVKGELPLDDAPQYYIENFEYLDCSVSQKVMDSTFNKCLDFLCSTEGVDADKYEVLGVEKKCNFKIGEYDFVGYIDLLLRDKATNEIIVCDYKSSDCFFGKKGKLLKKSENEFVEYQKQMYLYSKAIHDEYGEYPAKLCWIHFKDEGKRSVIRFNQEDFELSIAWAVETIERMMKESKFDPTVEWFYCNNLCDFRDGICEYLEEEGD